MGLSYVSLLLITADLPIWPHPLYIKTHIKITSLCGSYVKSSLITAESPMTSLLHVLYVYLIRRLSTLLDNPSYQCLCEEILIMHINYLWQIYNAAGVYFTKCSHIIQLQQYILAIETFTSLFTELKCTTMNPSSLYSEHH